jgi:hypothetical protein
MLILCVCSFYLFPDKCYTQIDCELSKHVYIIYKYIEQNNNKPYSFNDKQYELNFHLFELNFLRTTEISNFNNLVKQNLFYILK